MTDGQRMSGYKYIFGQAEWDTNVCDGCGKELSVKERWQACANMLHLGWMYKCRNCCIRTAAKLFENYENNSAN